jgi:hypothetical protein
MVVGTEMGLHKEIIVEAGIINLIKIITLRCQQQEVEVETNDFYEH